MVNLKFDNYVKKQLLISACLNIGHIISGYSIGWTSPVIPKLQDYEQTPLPDVISVTQASWVGSTFNIGALVGALISGPLANIIGRKSCMISAMSINVAGFIILALAVNLPMIFVGRIINGFSTASMILVHMVYIGEISSTNLRGIILTLTGVFHVLGSLLVYSVGPFVSYAAVSFILIGINLLYLLGIAFIPESPIYYLIKDNEKAVKDILTKLGRERDFEDLIKNFHKTKTENKKPNWREVFTIKSNRRSFVISVLVLTFQIASGVITVLSFATTIFQAAGSSIEPNLATIIIGLTQFAGTLVVPFLIERAGRKTLLSISTAGCCISATVMGMYFYLDRISHPAVPNIGWLPLATLVFMLVSYSIGLNIVPNTLLGELFRPNVRSVGVSFASIWGNIAGFLSITTFGYFVEFFGIDFTFWIFAICNGISFLLTLLYVPETKGKSLIEIEEMLS